MNLHPFDTALHLQRHPSEPHQFSGHTSPAYWNMIGPFGGMTAATALAAVMKHPDLLGEPLSLTVNYAGALTTGPFEVLAVPVRTNRSTQHWTVSILQNNPQGESEVTTTATIVTAARRETWGASDAPMPQVPQALEAQRMPQQGGVEWLKRYDMRPVSGLIPAEWDGSNGGSETQLWMRDEPPRALDFCSLAALSDIFFPRVWLRRATRVPAGTVSMTTYFHVGQAELDVTGTSFLLGQARAHEFRNGFFDQTGHLWNEAGQLLVSTHQIVYFKQ
jgi:acyl-CoA thioesterase